MPDPGLARRYANALFATAVDKDIVDQVAGDLSAVARLLDQNQSLTAFLHSPRVLESHRVELIAKVVGDRVHPLVMHFLRLLLDKNRFDHLGEIAESLKKLADAHHGKVRAQVYTAGELSAELEERLRATLTTATGKQVTLKCSVDPTLIGGVKVVMGDQLLDGSVRRGLERLREDLISVNVI